MAPVCYKIKMQTLSMFKFFLVVLANLEQYKFDPLQYFFRRSQTPHQRFLVVSELLKYACGIAPKKKPLFAKGIVSAE